ncbi:MAG TPA: protein jag [Candidatus Fimimorpha faecalis]|uniref:RNA-binding protein KhpB n=1 Tax=Candidatus Fimimorpha faecalis TaxID=2840824 RepID=A0A9D1JEI1_9FIRM|nr:protein jag [Candidatus Fimimorpha faecalis]
MADFKNYSAKTVEDAITQASVALGVTSDKLEYEVLEKGSSGLLGIFGVKPAVIKARKKVTVLDEGREFLEKVFDKMNMDVTIDMKYNEEEKSVSINLIGGDMGVLIGKRGQTLDSLQHLVSLVINKHSEDYLRVKLDTENYRERRKETLENLAKNIAYKVKRTRRPVSLEPMNPYERRIIHATLQDDRYVVTKSEGEEPFRHVIVLLKKERKYYDKKKGQ